MHFFIFLVPNDFSHADLVQADFSQIQKNTRAKDHGILKQFYQPEFVKDFSVNSSKCVDQSENLDQVATMKVFFLPWDH